jgi:sugar phosphate isomerase/epimerase
MLTRRRFTALTAAAAAALAAPMKLQAAATRSGLEFGLALYTVRNYLKDMGAMLDLIHQIGYATIELFPAVYNRPARELKALIESHGLKAPSGHFDYEVIADKVDYAAELGLKYMICPMIPRPQWDSLDGFRKAAAHLNHVSAKVTAAGMKLAYHAHNYEFKPIEGSTGFAVLMKELDPAVRLELDVYWVTEAGQNVLEVMKQNRQRLALMHLKDRKPAAAFSFVPGPKGSHFTEVGSGTIDWKAVIGEANRLGVKQYFVEEDVYDLPYEQAIRSSWNYLSKLAIS